MSPSKRLFFRVLVLFNGFLAILFTGKLIAMLMGSGIGWEPYWPILILAALSNTIFFAATLRSSGLWRSPIEMLSNIWMYAVNFFQALAVLYFIVVMVIGGLFEKLFFPSVYSDAKPILWILIGATVTIPNFVGLGKRRTAYIEDVAANMESNAPPIE